MSITPSPAPGPDSQPAPEPAAAPAGPPKSFTTPILILSVVLVLGLAGLFLYARSLNDRLQQTQASLQALLDSQGQSLQQIAMRLDQAEARQSELQGEVGATKQTLGSTRSELEKARQTAAELAKQQQAARQQLATQLTQLAEVQEDTRDNLGDLSSDVLGVRGEVKTTQSELEKTRSELQRVIGDLGAQSDLIAHTRGDLEALRARGDREYVEFDLTKAAKRQKVGTLQLELKKTDVKRQKYTVNLIADDRTIEKKDKTVFEPVQFYQIGYRQATEIVVQQILKDRIVGYVSAPKLRDAPATTSAAAR
jgi:septal ring factor EnvC (AmiA/AmiB activator)